MNEEHKTLLYVLLFSFFMIFTVNQLSEGGIQGFTQNHLTGGFTDGLTGYASNNPLQDVFGSANIKTGSSGASAYTGIISTILDPVEGIAVALKNRMKQENTQIFFLVLFLTILIYMTLIKAPGIGQVFNEKRGLAFFLALVISMIVMNFVDVKYLLDAFKGTIFLIGFFAIYFWTFYFMYEIFTEEIKVGSFSVNFRHKGPMLYLAMAVTLYLGTILMIFMGVAFGYEQFMQDFFFLGSNYEGIFSFINILGAVWRISYAILGVLFIWSFGYFAMDWFYYKRAFKNMQNLRKDLEEFGEEAQKLKDAKDKISKDKIVDKLKTAIDKTIPEDVKKLKDSLKVTDQLFSKKLGEFQTNNKLPDTFSRLSKSTIANIMGSIDKAIKTEKAKAVDTDAIMTEISTKTIEYNTGQRLVQNSEAARDRLDRLESQEIRDKHGNFIRTRGLTASEQTEKTKHENIISQASLKVIQLYQEIEKLKGDLEKAKKDNAQIDKKITEYKELVVFLTQSATEIDSLQKEIDDINNNVESALQTTKTQYEQLMHIVDQTNTFLTTNIKKDVDQLYSERGLGTRAAEALNVYTKGAAGVAARAVGKNILDKKERKAEIRENILSANIETLKTNLEDQANKYTTLLNLVESLPPLVTSAVRDRLEALEKNDNWNKASSVDSTNTKAQKDRMTKAIKKINDLAKFLETAKTESMKLARNPYRMVVTK